MRKDWSQCFLQELGLLYRYKCNVYHNLLQKHTDPSLQGSPKSARNDHAVPENITIMKWPAKSPDLNPIDPLQSEDWKTSGARSATNCAEVIQRTLSTHF